MKTSLSILLVYLILVTVPLFGQSTNEEQVIPTSLYSQNNGDLAIQQVIPVLNKGFVVYKADSIAQPELIELSFYDLNLQLISTKKIPTNRTDGLFEVEKIFLWNNDLVLLASSYALDLEKNQLLYYQFNLPDFQLIASKTILETIAPYDVYVPYFSKLSLDQSKLIVLGWDYLENDSKASITIKILDSQLTEIRNQSYQFNYANEKLALEDVFLDNAGKAYIVGNNYKGNLKYGIRPALIEHFITILNPDSTDKFWVVEKFKRFFPSFQYALANDGTFMGIGFWEKGVKRGIGSYIFEPNAISPTTSIQTIDYKTFKAAFIGNSNKLKHFEHHLESYEMKKVLVKENAFYIIGEHISFGILEDEYLLEDIIIAKVTPKGDIGWLKRIPKKQNVLTGIEQFNSFTLLEQKDKLYFLFNDNPENYGVDILKEIKIALVPDVQPAIVGLNLQTGMITRNLLRDTLDKNQLLIPDFCQFIAQNDALFINMKLGVNAGKLSLEKGKIPE